MNRTRRLPLYLAALGIVLLLALLSAGPSAAAPAGARTGRWVPLGPWGATVFALAADPADRQVFYAGTDAGLFATTDGMASWHLLTILPQSFIDPAVPAVWVDPTDSARIVIATEAMILKSEDRGVTWVRSTVQTNLNFLPEVTCLTADPTDPAVLYACSGATFGQGVLKSVDGGATFRAASHDLDSANVTAIAVDPAAPRTLYAAVPSDRPSSPPGPTGVVKSTDGGATWKASNAGLPLSRAAVRRVVVAGPGVLYAILGSGVLPSGEVWRSRDGAATWSALSAAPPALSLIASPGGILYLAGPTGGFRSRDGGATWTPTAPLGTSAPLPGLPAGFGVMLLGAGLEGPASVYAAAQGGVLRSLDGGRGWQLSKTGLVTVGASAAAIDRDSSLYTAVAEGGPLYKSPGGSGAFHRLGADVRLPTPDPADPARLFGVLPTGGRLGRSLDGGATWQRVLLPAACVVLQTIAVAPSDPRVVYAGGVPIPGPGNGHDPSPACVARCQAFRSLDGGDSWSCLPLDVVNGFVVDPARPLTVYALGAGSGSVSLPLARSTDGGLTWRDLGPALVSASGVGDLQISALAIAPTQPERLYAILDLFGHPRLFTSVDGGRSWSRSPAEVPSLTGNTVSVHSLVLDPRSPVVLYVGLLFGGILRTDDLGATWTGLTNGLAPGHTDGSLLIDPRDPEVLYAGSNDHGVFRIRLRR
jgi:photosystem II stability/assembly factor-like uncharacterized protein